ncbi:MAG: ion transporter [Muribaculaceae bacterium]|nr:ion transporter [Muribaculaceae bacterium]
MNSFKQWCKKVTTNKWFDRAITLVILLNCFFIGVETYSNNATVALLQSIILGIFTIEIILRFIAADSVKSFFSGGWNIFDLSLVLISYIPENLFANGSAMMALRVLRVFRVLRLLRSAREIKLIISVLIKSLSALFYNVIFFFIFVYLFAIIGVNLFRLPSEQQMTAEQRVNYEKLQEIAPNAPSNSPDPFGTLDEAFFTLFRELTGEDWTDVRYNLVTASQLGLIKVSPTVITTYHVLWFILSAFLLLNLVVGAIVNNYQVVMEESKETPPDAEVDESNPN